MMNILHRSEITERSHARLMQNNREVLDLTSKRREQRAVLPVVTFVALAEVQQQERVHQHPH